MFVGHTLGIRFLLALATAVGLWVYLESPGTRTVPVPTPITVEIKGQAAGLIVVPQPNQAWPPTVQINQASVPASLQDKVSSAWFVASVDVSDQTQPGTQLFPVSVQSLQPGVAVAPGGFSPTAIPITVDREMQTELPISLQYQGSVPPGYTPSAPVLDATRVSVRGPATVVQQVAAVIAVVRLDNRRASFHDTVQLIPQNALGGDVAQSGLLQLNPKTVQINVSIQQQQTSRAVPVLPQLTGQPALGYVAAGISVDPPEATLVGSPSALDSVQSVGTEPVDVGGATADVTKTVGLQAPKGTSVALGQKVAVTVRVQAIPASTIIAVAPSVTDAPADAQVQVGTPSLNLTLQGTAPLLQGLQPKDIAAVVSLDGLGPGTHDVAPAVSVPQGISVQGVSPAKVRVTIIPPTPTPTATATATPTPAPTATPSPAPTATATTKPANPTATPGPLATARVAPAPT